MGASTGKQFGNRGEESADTVVVFTGYDRATLAGIFQNQVAVQRFDGEHVDHRRLNALFRQGLRGRQSLGHHEAAGDDGDICALPKHTPLPISKSSPSA